MGQYITHGPVGPDGMLSTCDSDQPMDEGPVCEYVTRNPVGSDGMLSTCDSDQPASGIVGPVDPIRMFSQCKPDQPVAVGPVGQLFTTCPVGPCGMVSNHELHDPIADSPVGLTEIPNPVDETERPIQIDFMKIVQTDGPVSVVDTPPSSDSGVHSWGEQWENMSIRTTDTDTEQSGRPEICSPTGRCVGDTREPPNTKDGESDELSSSGSQNCNRDSQHNECMNFISDREPTSARRDMEGLRRGLR